MPMKREDESDILQRKLFLRPKQTNRDPRTFSMGICNWTETSTTTTTAHLWKQVKTLRRYCLACLYRNWFCTEKANFDCLFVCLCVYAYAFACLCVPWKLTLLVWKSIKYCRYRMQSSWNQLAWRSTFIPSNECTSIERMHNRNGRRKDGNISGTFVAGSGVQFAPAKLKISFS